MIRRGLRTGQVLPDDSKTTLGSIKIHRRAHHLETTSTHAIQFLPHTNTPVKCTHSTTSLADSTHHTFFHTFATSPARVYISRAFVRINNRSNLPFDPFFFFARLFFISCLSTITLWELSFVKVHATPATVCSLPTDFPWHQQKLSVIYKRQDHDLTKADNSSTIFPGIVH